MNDASESRPGVLLFAHGARDALWARPFEAVAQALREREPEMPVALGFLEFMTPDLRGAGDALAALGCRKVSVVPLFLGAGGHVRKDLPLLLDALRAAHPHIEWQLAPAVGEDAAVVAAMAEVAWRYARL
ncbi:CbiX/SirB N-terminal domain-containing protein [Methylibium sp.]|uniref:sirohydrochlorin chelatase n=1 Tax=Methylibium sp. TaxID=2067992 RepID=UPI0017DDB36F|nr:CbiX/SirB N-terminal domain-containing protein [Methylibium sp.]MBA3589444.1 CbiX/SirB N-terminal domain-containing protein [Methylibium sp.]